MIRYLITLSIITLLIVLIMVNNIPHGAELYAQISDAKTSHFSPRLHGYIVMGLLDMGILIMLFCNDIAISIALSVLLFVANVIFWKVPEDMFDLVSEGLTIERGKLLFWKIALSGMFSLMLHRLSDMLRRYVRTLQRALRKRTGTPIAAPALTGPIEFICENCGRLFASQNALNAHRSRCLIPGPIRMPKIPLKKT